MKRIYILLFIFHPSDSLSSSDLNFPVYQDQEQIMMVCTVRAKRSSAQKTTETQYIPGPVWSGRMEKKKRIGRGERERRADEMTPKECLVKRRRTGARRGRRHGRVKRDSGGTDVYEVEYILLLVIFENLKMSK